MPDWLKFTFTILSFLGVGAIASWYFWVIRRKALLGGYIGGVVAAFMGAVIASYFGEIIYDVLEWLMRPKFASVNFISAGLGAWLVVRLLVKLNHDRDRRDY